MRYLFLNIILITSILLVSCALIMPHNQNQSKNAENQIAIINLSTSPYTSIIQLDSSNSNLDTLAESFKANDWPFSQLEYMFELDKNTHVRIEFYDVLANLRLIWENKNLAQGTYEVDFTNLNLDPGAYIVRLFMDGEEIATRMRIIER